jgi:two-component system sensor histidine kinase YesM
MVPKTEFTSDKYNVFPEYAYIILFAVIMATLISMFIIVNITKPIKDLTTYIASYKNGNFGIKMPRYKYSELNEVSSNFNSMIDQIQYLFNEVYKKQIHLKEAELKALQAQINPHFIFNVLEIISWEARISENETIYKMTNSLGELLRARLTSNTREKIKIKEELEYVKFYLYLQEKRFEDKIKIDIFISDEKLLDYYIPKLSIQPIVENALVHGLENKIGKGNLNISIRGENKYICIEIMDDGIGFDTKKININNGNNEDSLEERKHIGLINVNQRLKMIYGKDYGVILQSEINKGSKISIYVPYDRGDNKCIR